MKFTAIICGLLIGLFMYITTGSAETDKEALQIGFTYLSAWSVTMWLWPENKKREI